MSLEASLHESAHAIGFLVTSVQVTEIALDADGGGYVLADTRDWPTVVAVLAGATAESLFCGRRLEDALSLGDLRIVQACELQAEQDLRRPVTEGDRRHWRDQAEAVVLNNENRIRTLAAELRARRKLDLQALTALAWNPNGSLGMFRHLYPKRVAPEPKPLVVKRSVVLSRRTSETSREFRVQCPAFG